VSFEAYASASSWGITSEARDIFSTAGGAVSSRIMLIVQKKEESALKSALEKLRKKELDGNQRNSRETSHVDFLV
jgi:hypothetical protein